METLLVEQTTAVGETFWVFGLLFSNMSEQLDGDVIAGYIASRRSDRVLRCGRCLGIAVAHASTT